MHAAELEFVKALAEATDQNVIRWETVPHGDREISRAEIDCEVVEVEFMYFTVATGEAHEKVLATVRGLKTHFQVAAGTEAYQILRSMFADKNSWQSAIAGLSKATARVRRLLGVSR